MITRPTIKKPKLDKRDPAHVARLKKLKETVEKLDLPLKSEKPLKSPWKSVKVSPEELELLNVMAVLDEKEKK